MTFKQWARMFLEVEGPISREERYEMAAAREKELYRRMKELENELHDCMNFIGALFDYLEVRPHRTFVQDYRRLPQEEHSMREVVQVVKAKKVKRG